MSRYKKEPKRRIRIKYRRAATALSLLLIVLVIFFSWMPASLGSGGSYDRKLLKKTGDKK